MTCWLLISPLSKMAYFGEYREVALAELGMLLNVESQILRFGDMEFFEVELDTGQISQICTRLLRLSFVQGVFESNGDSLTSINLDPGFLYPAELVYGQKYQGKTNELVTQLAINVGLNYLDSAPADKINLLYPMAGRGT